MGVAGGLGALEEPAEAAADGLCEPDALNVSIFYSKIYASFVSCSFIDFVRNFSALSN